MLYFGGLNVQQKSLVCDPFSANIDEVELPMLEIDKLIELRNDTSCRAKHQSVPLEAFCLHVSNEYSELADKAFRILIPFSCSYLCECGFSTFAGIKIKTRSRLNVEHALRLSRLTPRVDKICAERQAQCSH